MGNEEESIIGSISSDRPLITHLNADSSWLIQIPRPENSDKPVSRSHFNILLDPWLFQSQTDWSWLFSQQWHAIKPHVGSIEELETLLRATQSSNVANGTTADAEGIDSYIDLVIIAHEWSDHCHPETLKQVKPTVPIFAVEPAAALIKSWNHFTKVHIIPILSTSTLDWRTTSVSPLPSWLGVSRVVTKGDIGYLHSAVLLAFEQTAATTSSSEAGAEAILYTPHGIKAESLSLIKEAQPSISILALLHGLDNIRIRFLVEANLGGHNGLQVQRACDAKYWIGTHDEDKTAIGIVKYLSWRAKITVQMALEAATGKGENTPNEWPKDRRINYQELGSGESLLLA